MKKMLQDETESTCKLTVSILHFVYTIFEQLQKNGAGTVKIMTTNSLFFPRLKMNTAVTSPAIWTI